METRHCCTDWAFNDPCDLLIAELFNISEEDGHPVVCRQVRQPALNARREFVFEDLPFPIVIRLNRFSLRLGQRELQSALSPPGNPGIFQNAQEPRSAITRRITCLKVVPSTQEFLLHHVLCYLRSGQ